MLVALRAKLLPLPRLGDDFGVGNTASLNPQGEAQLLSTPAELEAAVRENPGPEPDWAEVLIEQFRSCNRLTLDELQQHLYAAGFAIHKVELLSEAVHLPPGIEQYPLSRLTVSGVKLIAGAIPHAEPALDDPLGQTAISDQVADDVDRT